MTKEKRAQLLEDINISNASQEAKFCPLLRSRCRKDCASFMPAKESIWYLAGVCNYTIHQAYCRSPMVISQEKT